MFSIQITKVVTNENEVRRVFEKLGFGNFDVVMIPNSFGSSNVYVNYKETTDTSEEFRHHLRENDRKQREGNPIRPVRIVYQTSRGERYWNVYWSKTPEEFAAEIAERIADRNFEVRVDYGIGGTL